LLTAAIGTGYVRGVQEHGVAATVKHYVANDFETERFTASADVSQRALRELYLAPFEDLVREAGAWAVMSAYNAVNGVPMSTNSALQIGVLRDEWGFDGAVISDWMGAHDTVGTANGGLDIVMPSRGSPWGGKLLAAVNDGTVRPEVIDEHVSRLLLLAARVGALSGAAEAVPPPDRPDQIDGAGLARDIAVRSFVLASNRDEALPLVPAELGSIALIGALAKHARVLGGGSATVFPAQVTSPLKGLSAALPPDVTLSYAVGADPRSRLSSAAGPAWTGLRAVFKDAAGVLLHDSSLASGAGRWMDLPAGVAAADLASVEISGHLTAAVTGVHRLGIRGSGKFRLSAAGSVLFEGEVRPESNDFSRTFLAPPEQRLGLPLEAGVTTDVTLVRHLLPGEADGLVSMSLGYGEPVGSDDELLAEAEQVAAASDVAIVVVGTTDEVESEGFDRSSLALPGQQDELVRRVAAAAKKTIVVVSAGSPVELPWADDVDAVLLTWFGGQEAGHALADVLLGFREPGGRLPTTWPAVAADCPVLNTTPDHGVLHYDEDIFIGYRAWERAEKAPRYPFGHGSGYTSWRYEQIVVNGRRVEVSVRNTGTRAGEEVVQVYVSPVRPAGSEPSDGQSGLDRPARWLAGFATAEAAPGEAVTIGVDLPARTFDVWADGWRAIGGDYLVEAAHSIADRRLTTVIPIP
ncbi:MAG: glycoside hydrolase family 3 C-terminal domain-containing protein, partial [Nocardiopsaceae bacterium]|nr:glycoside hydrolase family 3 C-terminal domain-containing protein [Nocardiopsaceae bacterium]